MNVFKKRKLFGKEPYKYILVGLMMIALGMLGNYLAGQFLDKYYPNPVTPDDLILDRIDEYSIFVKVGEIAGWMQMIWVVITVTQHNFRRSGEYLSRVGLFYILRAFTIILNPLAQMQDAASNGSNPVLAELFYKGMFFSGHTGVAFLLFFLHKENDKMKWVKFVTACIVGASVLLSHSHYSIDVVGGILAAYFIAHIKLPKILTSGIRE